MKKFKIVKIEAIIFYIFALWSSYQGVFVEKYFPAIIFSLALIPIAIVIFEGRKRLFNIILVLLFSTSGIGLILYSLNKNLDYFFTPTELKNINIQEDKRIKIGGMVLENSVVREQSKVIFTVTDYKNYIEVVYEGIVPDLFKEGSGVVALGFMQNETFYAQEVLAKHDENYMPPNLNINNDN